MFPDFDFEEWMAEQDQLDADEYDTATGMRRVSGDALELYEGDDPDAG